MASLMIHQVIGEEYLKRHQVDDPFLFLSGNLAPDLITDKKMSHYSTKCRNYTYTQSIENKVNLDWFCRDCNINTSFNQGYFLHLLTDKLYFGEYMLNNPKYRAIENEDQLYIQSVLYRDYHRNNKYLMEKYPRMWKNLLPQIALETRDDIDNMEMLDNKDIDEIIDVCANINLQNAFDFLCLEFDIESINGR